jgi:aspartate beta-hydroxylase
MRLLPSEQGRERVFTSEELEKQNLRGLDTPPSWTGYYFYRHGERRADNCESCPRTAAALEDVPLARVPGHAPEVLFSVFTPGTHLLPHRGVTNTRLVAHLPLMVPENCALGVGGEVHHWREGRVVVFDDTYEHEAWNRSAKTRVVLIFDVWNPYLIEAERAAVALLVAGIGEFRASVERA